MIEKKGDKNPIDPKDPDNLTTIKSCMKNQTLKGQVKDREVQEISLADLPLACPRPKMTLWNAHPKVYLPIEQTGQATCPYCSAEYVLKNV